MRKQIVLSSLFLVSGLLLSSVQAADLDDLKVCLHQRNRGGRTNPLLPKEELKIGYKCKTQGVQTENYSPDGYVQWTLVKKDGGKEIWAAHTGRWGPIYVGYIEDGYYSFWTSKEVCNKYEDIVLDKKPHKIEMTLPEIGFGFKKMIPNNPLNFELLQSLGYTSVIYNDKKLFWSRSHWRYGLSTGAWLFNSARGNIEAPFNRKVSVRCVGR